MARSCVSGRSRASNGRRRATSATNTSRRSPLASSEASVERTGRPRRSTTRESSTAATAPSPASCPPSSRPPGAKGVASSAASSSSRRQKPSPETLLGAVEVAGGRAEVADLVVEPEEALHLHLCAHHAAVGVLAQEQRDVVARLGHRLPAVVGEVEVDGRAARLVAAHAALQVAPVARRAARVHLGGVQEEGDLRVVEPVRREELELVGQGQGELVATGDGIDARAPRQVDLGEVLGGVPGERIAKGRQGVAPQTEAAGRAMAAEGEQGGRAGAHRRRASRTPGCCVPNRPLRRRSR